jgi:hypothetical protein
MPFFLIVPLWLLCLFAGLLLFLWPRFRFLSSYVVLSSTFGLVGAFVLSLGVLLISAKLLGGTRFAWVAIVAYLSGIVAGGAIGLMVGGYFARIVNRRLGWR